MVQLEKFRFPTALASAIAASAPRAIALPHLAPHGCSNGLALALALFGWRTVSLRLALALARIGWHSVSLRLALAPARFGHRGSRPLHLSAETLLQLGGQRAHGTQVELFDPGSGCSSTCRCALDTRGHRNQKLDPVSDLRPYDAKSDS